MISCVGKSVIPEASYQSPTLTNEEKNKVCNYISNKINEWEYPSIYKCLRYRDIKSHLLSKSEKISKKLGVSSSGLKNQIEEIFNSIPKGMDNFDTRDGLFHGLLLGPILDFMVRDDVNPEILARAKELFNDTDDSALLETRYEEYVENKFKADPPSGLYENGELLNSEKFYASYEKAAAEVVDKIIADHPDEKINFALVKSVIDAVKMPDDKVTTKAIKQLQKGNFDIKYFRNFKAYQKQVCQNVVDQFIFEFLGGKNPDPTDQSTDLFIQRMYLMVMGLASHDFESLKILQTGEDEKLSS